MSSVAKLVNKNKRTQERRTKEYQDELSKEKKERESRQFSGEVAYLIKKFEYNAFDLESTNKDVAKFITGFNEGRYYITMEGNCTQQMPRYVYVEPFLGQLKFYKTESSGRKNVTASSKYNKWKKTLEEQFGVEIRIGRTYTYKERFNTYDDKIFQGVLATVSVKE